MCLFQPTVGTLFLDDVTVFSKVFTIQLLFFVVETRLVFEGVVFLGGWQSRDVDLAFETAPAWSCLSFSTEAKITRGANDRLDEILDAGPI